MAMDELRRPTANQLSLAWEVSAGLVKPRAGSVTCQAIAGLSVRKMRKGVRERNMPMC